MHVYRRICLLRATGRIEEAARLEYGDLVRAMTEATTSVEAEISWSTLFAAEEKRVADASILAELLAPLLAEQLHLSPAQPATAGLAAVLDAFPAKSPRRPPAPGAAPPEVADLIEGMLAQERDETRLRTGRRAS